MDEVEMNYRGTKKNMLKKREEKAQGGRFTGKLPALCRVEEVDRHLEERRRQAAPRPATTDDTMRD